MNKSIIATVLLFFVLFTGCRKDGTGPESNGQAVDLTNLTYGSHASQKMDVYLPGNRNSQTKVIVFVHGGFWLAGDKEEMSVLAKKFRDLGYACASINYRLANTFENNIHPAQVSGLGKALEFINKSRADWEISSGSVALIGASAGGHLAILYTYTYNSDNRVATVISLAGPTNLLNMQNASEKQGQVLQWFLGAGPQTSPAVYQQASPINHVNASSKPTLLLHGKLDDLVPFQQSIELKNKLDQFGIKNKLVTYEDIGHDVNFNSIPGLLAECESWLTENLQ